MPRYRQRIRWVPGRLANPVWVDDEDFDVTYHVRRSALPRPGTDAQLRELVGRVQSRPLDRNRPLWEMYLVEGLSDDRFAIITKTHHAMVDGIGAVDIGQVILDTSPEPRETPAGHLAARRRAVLGRAGGRRGRRDRCAGPSALVDTVRGGLSELPLAPPAGWSAPPAACSPRPRPRRAAGPGQPAQRGRSASSGATPRSRSTSTTTGAIRKAHGGTVNDVVLATVAGALRAWLLTRGETVGAVDHGAGDGAGERPAGERAGPAPATGSRPTSSTCRSASRARSCGCTRCPTGCRRTRRPARRSGPRRWSGWPASRRRRCTRWARGSPAGCPSAGSTWWSPTCPARSSRCTPARRRMLAAYPVVPLAKGQAVSIGLTSYDGGVFYGLNADRDAMPDVDVLAQCLDDALAELLRDRAGEPDAGEPAARARARRRRRARRGLDDRRARARWPRSRGSTPHDADVIVGTSAGSVLAALLGAGVTVGRPARPPARACRCRASVGLDWDYDQSTGGALPTRPRLAVGSPALLRARR